MSLGDNNVKKLNNYKKRGEGADGGVDILAGAGPLGFGMPRLSRIGIRATFSTPLK
jgi:hypothetical protein